MKTSDSDDLPSSGPLTIPVGEIKPMDDPVVVADEKAHPGAWTALTDEEYKILIKEPKSNRMFQLRHLRPEMTYFQRKMALKTRGLR